MKKTFAILLALLLVMMTAGCKDHEKDELIIQEFTDTWYAGGDLTSACLDIQADGSWMVYDVITPDQETSVLQSGESVAPQKDGSLVLVYDGKEVAHTVSEQDGSIRIQPDDMENWCFTDTVVFYREKDSGFPSFDSFIGLWKYAEKEEWLNITADGSWSRLDRQNNPLETGTLLPFTDCIVLEGSSESLQLFFSEQKILSDNFGNALKRVDKITVPAFFEENGLKPNIKANGKNYAIKNGIRYVVKETGKYVRGDGAWKLNIVDTMVTDDGFKDVVLQAVCTFTDQAYQKLNASRYTHGTDSYLYDYYTGAALPNKATYGDEDNTYSCTLESNGKSYGIHYSIDVEWKKVNGKQALYKTMHIMYPEDYDGLMFCMLAADPDFEQYQQSKLTADIEKPTVMNQQTLKRIQNGLVYQFDKHTKKDTLTED